MATSRYPIERVNNFSDAIFAIAITLLVLEIKVPSADEVAREGIAGVLMSRMANFIGFLVSFFVTALFWKGHLQLFKSVTNVTNQLFWLNLWQLLFVVLMPFSTALYSYFAGFNGAFFFYCLNVAAIGISGYRMTAYVLKSEPTLQQMPAVSIRWMRVRALVTPLVFLLCIPLAMLNPWAGRLGFVLIFMVHAVGDWLHQRRLSQMPPPDSIAS